MNRISQEGANHIARLLDGVVDSITKKLTGPQIKKVEDEMATIVQLWKQIQDEWEKV
tara:strand:+ start:2738 stop:2908 length:171 start_codon:yes stop_codon:yes gene_type:complete